MRSASPWHTSPRFPSRKISWGFCQHYCTAFLTYLTQIWRIFKRVKHLEVKWVPVLVNRRMSQHHSVHVAQCGLTVHATCVHAPLWHLTYKFLTVVLRRIEVFHVVNVCLWMGGYQHSEGKKNLQNNKNHLPSGTAPHTGRRKFIHSFIHFPFHCSYTDVELVMYTFSIISVAHVHSA